MRWDDRIGRRVKLHDLHILLAIVQCGSMSKAAKQLSVSNPVVSRAIADLEHSLGVRLLDRNAHGVEPTIYGRALLDRGLVVFDELREAVKQIEHLSNPTSGELRIASLPAIGSSFLAAVIEGLTVRYPGIVLHVLAVGADAANSMLDERKVDLVINRMFEPVDPGHFHTEILYDEPLVVAAGAQSPWTKRRRLKLADLVNELWALPPPHSIFGSAVAEAFRASRLDVPRTAVVTTAVPLRNALLRGGRFLTIVPASVLGFPTKSPAFAILPIRLPVAPRPIVAIRLKSRTPSPLVQLFIDCARDVATVPAKRK